MVFFSFFTAIAFLCPTFYLLMLGVFVDLFFTVTSTSVAFYALANCCPVSSLPWSLFFVGSFLSSFLSFVRLSTVLGCPYASRCFSFFYSVVSYFFASVFSSRLRYVAAFCTCFPDYKIARNLDSLFSSVDFQWLWHSRVASIVWPRFPYSVLSSLFDSTVSPLFPSLPYCYNCNFTDYWVADLQYSGTSRGPIPYIMVARNHSVCGFFSFIFSRGPLGTSCLSLPSAVAVPSPRVYAFQFLSFLPDIFSSWVSLDITDGIVFS